MLVEESPLNMFESIYTSTPKTDHPTSFIADSQIFFAKKMESVRQFVSFLDQEEENVSVYQQKWQRDFYKNQLKAALFMNYSLTKLYARKQEEMQKLKQTIEMKSDRLSHQKSKYDWRCIEESEDIQNRGNCASPIKHRALRQAFEAEKQIINAKHQHQCDQIRKMYEHIDCKFKASKQENQYLRGQLISMTEKIQILSKENSKLLHKQAKNKDQMKLRNISCSPIAKCETFAIEQDQISFNNEYFNECHTETKFLKRQVEQLQQQFKQLQITNQKLENENEQKLISMQELLKSKAQDQNSFVQLQQDYKTIEKELTERVMEIERYRKVIEEIKELSRTSRNHKSEKERLEQEIKVLKKQMHEMETFRYKNIEVNQIESPCHGCAILKNANQELGQQLKKVQVKFFTLKQKFDRTLCLQLTQRKQWQIFFRDLSHENTN